MCKNCIFYIFWQTWKELPFENSKLVPILIVFSLFSFFSYLVGIKNDVFEDPNSLPSTIPEELNQPSEPKFQPISDAITNKQPENVLSNNSVSNQQDLLNVSQQEEQNVFQQQQQDIQVHSGSTKVTSRFPILCRQATLWFLVKSIYFKNR